MATRCKKSSNESIGSGDSASGGDRVCHCGLKAPLKVSHSYANSGREYYSCPARRCKWFKWAGPPIEGASSIDPQTNERLSPEYENAPEIAIMLQWRLTQIEKECLVLKMFAITGAAVASSAPTRPLFYIHYCE
ncbi:hypothetical protein PIB30_098781 [Stylosanthes scabra]|uniref:GRF-type domain-containing protein n=1 Tax=Stylosanthes scabra TaxID=79078 RepID=A0ABU6ZVI7_9FABA|nr:hypothetical protein [Stylosanthes scabra]